jgi:single-strand DNA-binding protein
MAHVNINRVVMTGNLTADAELPSVPSRSRVVTFRIACNGLKDKVDFFRVNFWGPYATKLAESLTKGRAVAIEGRLESKEWEAEDGSKRYATVIVAEKIEFLGSRCEETAAPSTTARRGRTSGTRTGGRAAAKGSAGARGRAKGATRGRASSKA